MRRIYTVALGVFMAGSAAGGAPAVAATEPGEEGLIERGRYITQIGGCNDCHTPGYPESEGQIPEHE